MDLPLHLRRSYPGGLPRPLHSLWAPTLGVLWTKWNPSCSKSLWNGLSGRIRVLNLHLIVIHKHFNEFIVIVRILLMWYYFQLFKALVWEASNEFINVLMLYCILSIYDHSRLAKLFWILPTYCHQHIHQLNVSLVLKIKSQRKPMSDL